MTEQSNSSLVDGALQTFRDSGAQIFDATPPIDNETDEDAWQEPFLFDNAKVPEIPCTILPGWLGEFAQAVSNETQTPGALSVMLALAVIATCAQKLAIVAPFGDGYCEPLNIWTATVLPPASRKTAVFKPFTTALTEWETTETENAQERIIEFETRESVNKKNLETLERDAAKAEGSDKNALLVQINRLRKELAELRPVAPRLWTGDVTAEQLQNMLVEHNERMSVLSDEGGIFEVMTGLYTDGRSNMDVFLQAHAGKSVRVDRGSRTVILNEPVLSFGLAVQPSIIADLGAGNKKRLRGNGCLARFLYCFPESNIGTRDLRARASVATEIKVIFDSNINHLLNMRQSVALPLTLQLSADAHECWMLFAEAIERRQGRNGDLEAIQDWSGKLPGQCLRIAGLMHTCVTDLEKSVIELDIMERAVRLSSLLIPHAQAVFNVSGTDQSIEDAKYIFDWLARQEPKLFLKQRDLQRLPRYRDKDTRRMLEAVKVLQERQILGKRRRIGKTKPSWVFPINPMLLTENLAQISRIGTGHVSPETLKGRRLGGLAQKSPE